jgi:hypothetical protein
MGRERPLVESAAAETAGARLCTKQPPRGVQGVSPGLGSKGHEGPSVRVQGRNAMVGVHGVENPWP